MIASVNWYSTHERHTLGAEEAVLIAQLPLRRPPAHRDYQQHTGGRAGPAPGQPHAGHQPLHGGLDPGAQLPRQQDAAGAEAQGQVRGGQWQVPSGSRLYPRGVVFPTHGELCYTPARVTGWLRGTPWRQPVFAGCKVIAQTSEVAALGAIEFSAIA